MTGTASEKYPEIPGLYKGMEKVMSPLRADKDYIPMDSADDIFKHLGVGTDIGSYFTSFEKRSVAKALIDSKNVFEIKMSYRVDELGDLASMSEFFKPLTEDGIYLAAFIIANGDRDNIKGYDFHLFF